MGILINLPSNRSRGAIAKRLNVDRTTLHWLCNRLYAFSKDHRKATKPYAPLGDFPIWQLSILTSETFRRSDGKLNRIKITEYLNTNANDLSYANYAGYKLGADNA